MCLCPVNTILPQMEAFEGRLAYVGLPDQVAALRRLQAAGHPGALKVDYVLGPYVGTIMYFAAIESFLRSNGVQQRRRRYRTALPRGRMAGVSAHQNAVG